MTNHYTIECKGGCGRILCDNSAPDRRTGLCKDCRYKMKIRKTSFSGRGSMSISKRKLERKRRGKI